MSHNQVTWVKATKDQIDDMRGEHDFVEGADYYVTPTSVNDLKAIATELTQKALNDIIQDMLSTNVEIIISGEAMKELEGAVSRMVHDTIAYHEGADIFTFYEDTVRVKGVATREALEKRGIPFEDGPGGAG